MRASVRRARPSGRIARVTIARKARVVIESTGPSLVQPEAQYPKDAVPMRFVKTMTKVLLALSLMAPLFALGQARSLRVDQAKSRAMFESSAKLETINGVSSEVRGRVELDPADLTTARATVEIPVASIRTGIDVRDEHLRGEKWLDAAKHPEIRFELTRVEGPTSLARGEEVSAKLHGTIAIHGVEKPIVANAKVKWMGSAVEAKARFQVKLSDHGIAIPEIVRFKVANEITVRVQLIAS
jgi:polyisoprenoid-binding protein YceI